jgi:tartrate dehydratase alpha subunit/fumarate hydratase class I-like protein
VPGHRHGHHHGQEGPRLDRRRRRGRIWRRRLDAYTKKNLRYSQLAPLSMFEEKNTKNNLPAQIDIYAEGGDAYKFLFIAKGGGSANKTFLFQGRRRC